MLSRSEEIIFGNDVDIEDIIWMGPQESMLIKSERVGVSKTLPFSNIYSYLKAVLQQGRKIHFLPPYRAENKILLEDLFGISISRQKDFVSVELIKAIVALRSVKEPCEIAEIEKACATGYQMHTAAMKMAIPGVWEQTITGHIEGLAVSDRKSVV